MAQQISYWDVAADLQAKAAAARREGPGEAQDGSSTLLTGVEELHNRPALPTPPPSFGLSSWDPGKLRFLVDWCAGTAWGITTDELCRLLAVGFLGASPDEDDHRAYFEQKARGARGCKLLLVAEGIHVYADPEHGQHIMWELKGSALAAVHPTALVAFLEEVKRVASRWHLTRLDLTWDHVPFHPWEMYQAARAGNVRTPLRRRPGWISYRDDDAGVKAHWEDGDEGELSGQTAYLGRKDSARRVLCYNARGFNRLEMRLHHEWATAAIADLLAVPLTEWSGVAKGYLRRLVDFVNTDGVSNISRAAELLPWWRLFLDGAERAAVRIERKGPKKLVQDVAKDAVRAARKLVVILDGVGPKALGRYLGEARTYLRAKEAAAAKRLRAAVAVQVEALGLDHSSPGSRAKAFVSLFDQGPGLRMA